jgi:hypothetical protein
MTAREMLYELELSVDRVSSKAASNLPLPAKVAYLNRGQIALALSKYQGDNKAGTGFEETQKRVQDLQRLHKTNQSLTVTKFSNEQYHAALSGAVGFMLLTRIAGIKATKGECKSVPMKFFIETQTDDLNEDFQNPNRNPNFDWREVLYRTAEDNLQVFTDGTFAIDSVVIDYLRYPNRIDVAGYKHFDKTLSTDVDCELPAHTHDEIVRLAALEFDFDINNPAAQSKAQKLMMLEK